MEVNAFVALYPCSLLYAHALYTLASCCSTQGCLGHGEVDLYRGQLLPTRVLGVLEHRQGGRLYLGGAAVARGLW